MNRYITPFGHHYRKILAATFTIQLLHLRFLAPHGVFGEEATVGNEFEINLSLEIGAPEQPVVSLHETVNYAAVHETVRLLFAERTALLETLAMKIAAKLKAQFPTLRKASVQIIKLHPPITSFAGSVSVTYNTDFAS